MNSIAARLGCLVGAASLACDSMSAVSRVRPRAIASCGDTALATWGRADASALARACVPAPRRARGVRGRMGETDIRGGVRGAHAPACTDLQRPP